MQHNIDIIFRNSRWAVWIRQFLSLISAFVITRLLIQELGLEKFGVFSIYLSIFTIITSTDFGLSYSMSRFISRHNKSTIDIVEKNSFYSACFLVIFSVAILQLIALVLSGFIYMSFSPQVAIDIKLLLIVGGLVNLSFIFGLNRFVFAGFQMYGIHGVGKIINIFVYIIVIYLLFLNSRLNIENALWTFAITKLVANIFMLYILLRQFKGKIRLPWKDFHKQYVMKKISEFVRYGLVAWLFSLSTIIYATLTVIITGIFLPGDAVSSLKIVLVILSMMMSSITGFMQPLSTIISQYENSKKTYEAYHNLYVNVVILSVMAGVLYVFYGTFGIGYLLGEGGHGFMAQQIFNLSLLVVVPVLIFMPLFICRFAIVGNKENSRYSRNVFYFTVLSITIGTIGVVFYKDLLPIVLSVSFVLVFRSIYAYIIIFKSNKPHAKLIKTLQHILVLSLLIYSFVFLMNTILFSFINNELYVITTVSFILFLMYIAGRRMLTKCLVTIKEPC